jgi:hypothetical protein
MVRTLYTDDWVSLLLDESGVLRYVRTETPYLSNAQMAAIHAKLARLCDSAGRDRHPLLVDMRRAPLNNDPAFEKVAERARALLIRDFTRLAVLVRTAVGSLQVKRHLREDGLPFPVLSSEAQALDYLTGKIEIEEAPPSSMSRQIGGLPHAGAHLRRRR